MRAKYVGEMTCVCVSVCLRQAENGADDSSTLFFHRCLFSGSKGAHLIRLAASDYLWVFLLFCTYSLGRESSHVSDIENVFHHPVLRDTVMGPLKNETDSFVYIVETDIFVSTITNRPFKIWEIFINSKVF